jgi:hypothetical protein
MRRNARTDRAPVSVPKVGKTVDCQAPETTPDRRDG